MKTRDDRGWEQGIPMPAGLSLVRVEPFVVQEPGPGGREDYDLVDLSWYGGSVLLLVAFRDLLVPRDVGGLAERLDVALGYFHQRQQEGEGAPPTVLRALATARASPKVVEACLARGLALIDRTGTIAVNAGSVLVRIAGLPPPKRTARAQPPQPFEAKGCRVVRVLLAAPQGPHTARALAKHTQVPHAHVQAVLAQLDEAGLVARASVRSGYRVVDPAGLLRAWIDSGERTVEVVESFHAPSTDEAALRRADAACREAGIPAAFTLASALLPGEAQASELPHGLYVAGDLAPVVDALQLTRAEPHDFFVFRADPEAEAEAGGILFAPRELPHGRGVALPQLVVDFAHAGGNGPDQAEVLLDQWTATLPIPDEE